MNIPKEAIEAAAGALMRDYNIPSMRLARQEARTALKAAAPLIAAQAVRDAAEDMDGLGMETVTAQSLWSRATELEAPHA